MIVLEIHEHNIRGMIEDRWGHRATFPDQCITHFQMCKCANAICVFQAKWFSRKFSERVL